MNRRIIGDYRKIIGGKNVMILFGWNKYSPTNYREDFKAYKQYLESYYSLHPDALKGLKNSTQIFPEEKEFLETMAQEIEFDLAKHPKELLDKEMISFEEFRKHAEEKLSNIIFELFEQDKELMPPGKIFKNGESIPTFSVEIDIESVKDRDWYFTHFFHTVEKLFYVDHERMYYHISGYWILHNIVIPACHLPDETSHHEDAKVFIFQQLKEHQDSIEGNLLDDERLGTELKGYLRPGDSRNVRYVYMTVHGVWSAILSEFYSVYRAKKFIAIPPGSINNYRRLLEALVKQPQNKVTSFYEQYIGYSNMGPSGEYSMGKIMGALAVAVASEEAVGNSGKKPYDIFLDGKVIETKNLSDRAKIINNAISNRQEISLGNFDPLIVNKVLATIRAEKDFIKFIDYVERCFNVFNIYPENQIFNKSMFKALLKKANEKKKK